MVNLDEIADTVSNLSLYDIKSYIRKAQNVVMNYTEMEAKVREATNNEPWGASSSLMQEIADGTHNYASFNEIMPMIYRRFTEKSAEEWRQIYKSLQLLEFIIKNGSERVIDDARAHLSTIKFLRNFHYIDEQGKDQGVNVRNRAKEVVDLLNDSESLRGERRKAKQNRNKYGGVSSDLGGGGGGGGAGGFGGTGKKYGGFGSDAAIGGYGGYSGGVYGDGGGTTTGPRGNWKDESSRPTSRGPSAAAGAGGYDAYDEHDAGASSSSSRPKGIAPAAAAKPEPPKAAAPVADLFSFDDPVPVPVSASSSKGKAPADDGWGSFETAAPVTAPAFAPAPTAVVPNADDDDDEFGDFASAAPPASAPAPISPQPHRANYAALSGMGVMTPPVQPAAAAPQYGGFQAPAAQANYAPMMGSFATAPAPAAVSSTSSGSAGKAKSGDAFGSLWSMASGKAGEKKGAEKGSSMAQLAQETSSAKIWGSTSAQTQAKPSAGNGLDDLLF
ncbi:Epsin-3, clathrin recruitment and traffic between the Golgi and endosome [Saitoella coloradoensis]